MVFKQGSKFVVCVKVDKKILREDREGNVDINFGSEYAICLKNLNSVRAVAKVSVDGKDATGIGLIIPANGSIDLERFIKDNNLHSGNKFKFIERTANIENHRGIGSDDGLIRVEILSEKLIHKQQVATEHIHHHYNDYYHPWQYPYGYPYRDWKLGGWIQSNTFGGAIQGNQNFQSCDLKMSETEVERGGATASLGSKNMGGIMRSMAMNASTTQHNDAGITVAGSESHQRFSIGENFPLEEHSSVIVLQLRGKIGESKITHPVTVKTKLTCVTCGKLNKSINRFCRECGTALTSI